MKKKIIISFLTILIIALVIGIYTQLWKPLIIVPKEARGTIFDEANVIMEAQAEEILNDEYDKANIFIHSFDGTLPSQNPEDYMTLYCTVGVKNRSIFHMNTVTAFVFEIDNYEENVLFSLSSDAVVQSPSWRNSSWDETFIIDLYIADMDEATVRDLIKGLKAKVIYEGSFTGVREEIIDFAYCENITLGFAD